MLPEPELRRAIADIKTVPLHGPFNRLVSFDAMVSPPLKAQMSAINRLARGIADDFNNLLTIILSYSELALDAVPTASPLENKLQEILSAARRGAQLTRELLAFSRTQVLELDPVSRGDFGLTDMAMPRPLWGIGSIKNGGRYNRPSGFEVIYLAEDPMTSLAEVSLVFRPNPDSIGKIKGPPLVHVAVDGALEAVLDLTNSAIQDAVATSHQELTGSWLWEQAKRGEAPTQRLGRIAFESERICALRYPSSKNPGGFCVAVFPERLSGNSYVEVFDPFDNLAQRIPPVPPKQR